MMKLEELYKIGSDCKFKSCPDSSVGESVWTEFVGLNPTQANFL